MSAPLIDKYRKMASFDWKKLKIELEGEDYIKAKESVIERMKADPAFQRDYRVLSREEAREINFRRWKSIIEWGLVNDVYSDSEGFQAMHEVLESFDQGTSARFSLHSSVFAGAVKSMGTERHAELIKKIDNNECRAKVYEPG
uniref:Uncharacterized protein n=1 Tax=Caenorhabditis japonica TaxID=281687 RepID=A0A8R1DNC6_CAEJA